VAIDLNADVGEGCGSDDALLEVVTSASVACGLHAGDAGTMRRTCAAAAARGVRIGAHLGYDDREGFGRRALDVPLDLLAAQTSEQIEALAAFGAVVFVKPHGALYHRACSDRAVAKVIVAAAGSLPVVGPPRSALLEAAGERGIAEGFADRAYAADGSLVDRSRPGALLDGQAALDQAVALATASTVDTLCVHGDTDGAVQLARAVRRALEAAGLEVRAFAT
jgi:UPF0271 protein